MAQTAITPGDINDGLVATREVYTTDGLVDQVFSPQPLLEVLKPEFSAQDGGRKLLVDLEVAKNTQTQWGNRSGSFDENVSDDIMTQVGFDWSKPLTTNVRLKFQDLEENTGKGAKHRIVKAQWSNAKRSHSEEIVSSFTDLDGAKDANAFLPLDTVIHDTTAIGGLDPTYTPDAGATYPYSYWAAKRTTDNTTPIKEVFRDVSDEIYLDVGERPDLILAGYDVFREYEDSVDAQVRYRNPNENGTMDTRFREIEFGGQLVRLVQDIQPDRAYFVKKRTLQLRHLNDNFMKVRPVQDVQGTQDKHNPILSILAFGCSERRANGVLIRA